VPRFLVQAVSHFVKTQVNLERVDRDRELSHPNLNNVTGRPWQIGDTVRVRLHEFAESGAGCQTSIQVDGGSVFAPFSRFPLLTPGGRTKSPQEVAEEFTGRTVEMTIKEITNARGRRRLVGCVAEPILRRIMDEQKGKTVEVRVHAYFKGGLHASYAGMLVFIPWVYVKNGTFERTQELGRRYRGKVIAISFIQMKDSNLVGSEVHCLLAKVPCQVDKTYEVPIRRSLSGGLEGSFDGLRVFLPWTHLIDAHQTPEELTKRYMGKTVTVCFLEVKSGTSNILGSMVHHILENVTRQEVEVLVHGHNTGGLVTSYNGLRCLVPWQFVSENNLQVQREFESRYKGKTMRVTLIEAEDNTLIGSMMAEW